MTNKNIDQPEKYLDVNMSDIDIDKELTSVRGQGFGFYRDYITPIEKSKKASEHLISNAGKPLDFDKFHKDFELIMDKGGELFPYDTLNWHTHLQLKHKGYEYKLFCIDDHYGNLMGWKRYILVDKKDKIVYFSKPERDKRCFNNEHHYYNGVRYNSNFRFVSEEAEDYPLYDKGMYYYTPMSLNMTKESLLRQKENIAIGPNTERLIKEINWLVKEIDSILGQITICKSSDKDGVLNKYTLSKELGESIIQILEEYKEGREIYSPLKYLEPSLSEIEDSLQKVKKDLYFAEYEFYEFIKKELPEYMKEKIEKKLKENSDLYNDLQKLIKQVEEEFRERLDKYKIKIDKV